MRCKFSKKFIFQAHDFFEFVSNIFIIKRFIPIGKVFSSSPRCLIHTENTHRYDNRWFPHTLDMPISSFAAREMSSSPHLLSVQGFQSCSSENVFDIVCQDLEDFYRENPYIRNKKRFFCSAAEHTVFSGKHTASLGYDTLRSRGF